MAIDKAYYPAPEGEALTDGSMMGEPMLELDIISDEPPEIEINEDGGIDILLGPDLENEPEFDDNLAEYMDEDVLNTLASDLCTDFEEDCNSRRDWMQTYVDGLELLGLKIEERNEPWDGACGVYHPLLTEALVKFQSETMMATFPAAGPVKTQIRGRQTPDKKQAAERVQADMNDQLTNVMVEYRPEHERMLWGLGLAGNAFKKVYFDPSMQRQVAIFVPAEDIVVPYGASNVETAERVTHVMRKTPNELRKLQVSGFYLDIDLGEPNNVLDDVEKKIAEQLGFRAESDGRYKLLEMQVDLDLPGYEHLGEDGMPTGIALPYIVTLEKGSNRILAIRRNWIEGDTTHTKRQHVVHYGYVPGFGFYCFGLVHLVGAFAKSGTSLIRQLVDSGTLANLPGGYKTRGMRVKGDDTPIGPGEWRDVDVPSGTIRDNMFPLPYKEPSQTLLALMNQIVDEGRRFANTADLQISDMSANTPVGTTLAILERTLKVMSAVQARIHYSMRRELVILKQIIADHTPDEYEYVPHEGERKAKKADYDDVDVIPVSDPNASTMAQKIVQYQAVLQLAQGAPHLYNLPLLHRQMLDVLGIKEAEKLIPMDTDHKPTDPITENQNVLSGKPVKAFLHQDHKAHIAVHMAAMQDPKIIGLLQNNPRAGAIQAAALAHISEHLGFEYRKQIEQELGMVLPPMKDEAGEDIPMAPEVEVRLSPMLAQAAQQLLQKNTAEIQQQEAQKQAEDPLVQMQKMELELKKRELELKEMQAKVNAAAKADQLDIEQRRIESQKEIAGINASVQLAKFQGGVEAEQALEQFRAGIELQKTGAKLAADTAAKIDDFDLRERDQQMRKTQMDQQAMQELLANAQPQQPMGNE